MFSPSATESADICRDVLGFNDIRVPYAVNPGSKVAGRAKGPMRLYDYDDRATRDELIVSLRARGWSHRRIGRDRRVRLSAPTVQQILAANGVNGSVVHAAV